MSTGPIRYTCLGCDQQVNTIGGQFDSADAPDVKPIPVCAPCYVRVVHDQNFERQIEARVEQQICIAQLQKLMQGLDVPPAALSAMAAFTVALRGML